MAAKTGGARAVPEGMAVRHQAAETQAVGRSPMDDYDPEINARVGARRPVGWPACRWSRPKCPHRSESAA